MLSNSAKCPCGLLSRNINIFNFTHSYISCTICHYTFLHFWSLHESSFFNWVAIDNTKFLHASSFMYVLPKSTPCFISRWQRCGKLVKGISLFATKKALSNNLSIFWATSWETVQSIRGSGAKRGFSATLMAATARLWTFYFLWLRIDSILKFVEPVTNTDEESLSVVLLQQGLHCI